MITSKTDMLQYLIRCLLRDYNAKDDKFSLTFIKF